MTSNQPYMLRAMYDWLVDNDLTPHLVVDCLWPAVQVPEQFIKDDQIVLNVSPSACVNFTIDIDQGVSFQARFGGVPHLVYFPCGAVTAIYARENGAGSVFDEVRPESIEPADLTENKVKSVEKKRPQLSIVK